MPAADAQCTALLDRVNARLRAVSARFAELAESRTGDERLREHVIEALMNWFVLGREAPEPGPPGAQEA
jgi:hypothetical protein